MPVRPAVELVRQAADLRLLLGVRVEVGCAGEHAREQEGRVDGGELALPDAAARLHVEEVVVEAAVARRIRLGPLRAVAEEAQPAQHDLGSELARDHAALDDHRNGRQSEPHGGDAARGVGVGLVSDQAVGRVGLVQVVLQRRSLETIQLLLRRKANRILRLRRPMTHRSALATADRRQPVSLPAPAPTELAGRRISLEARPEAAPLDYSSDPRQPFIAGAPDASTPPATRGPGRCAPRARRDPQRPPLPSAPRQRRSSPARAGRGDSSRAACCAGGRPLPRQQ